MTPQPIPRRHDVVPIDSIQPYPGNPRIGHRPTLDASLNAHGQFDDLIVQESTGHIIAGNNTWHSMRDAGATEVAVAFVDVDDDQALRMNLVHNRAGDKSSYDDRLLLERLGELDDLDGTGYDPGDLDTIEGSLTAPDLDTLAESVGEPADDDGWPSISVRVPYQVMAAWRAHLDTHQKDGAAAMAALLGIDIATVDH